MRTFEAGETVEHEEYGDVTILAGVTRLESTIDVEPDTFSNEDGYVIVGGGGVVESIEFEGDGVDGVERQSVTEFVEAIGGLDGD